MARPIELPHDMLLEISKYLDLRSILSFLRTCKVLFQVTKERQIWVEYVQRLIDQYGLLTTPVDFPSMSLTDLKRTATRPYRFESALCKKRLAKRTPEPMKPIYKGNRTLTFFVAKVIPGGEYLVTAAVTGWGGYVGRDGLEEDFISESVISVWDIRSTASANISRIADFKVEDYQDDTGSGRRPLDIKSINIRLGDKGGRRTALIIVRSRTHDLNNQELPNITRVQVLRFDPSNTEAVFSVYRVMTVDIKLDEEIASSGAYFISADSTECSVFLWNWEDDTWAYLDVLPPDLIVRTVSLVDSELLVWKRDANEVVKSAPLRDFLTPIQQYATRPDLCTLPSDEKHWTRVVSFASLNPSLDMTGTVRIYPSKPWLSGAPHSMLVHYDNLTVYWSGSTAVSYDTQDGLRRSFGPLALGHDNQLSVFAETISGHRVAISNNGGIGIFSQAPKAEGEGEAQFHRIFTSINHTDTPTQCPFICPISGTIGYAGSWGDIYVVHQK